MYFILVVNQLNVKSYEEMIQERRIILKSLGIPHIEWEAHQRKGVLPPLLEKPCPKDGVMFELTKPDRLDLGGISLAEAIKQRESRRKYTLEALKLEELSFLLWATQGLKSIDRNKVWTKRTVPSAGARHPFETYLIINRVDDLKPGVYRYLAIEHKLLLVNDKRPLPSQVSEACWGQAFVGDAAVVFIWVATPYRAEWRYSTVAYKGILVDVGHICQNLYLACESIGAGACAILAYEQEMIDALIGVDGENEFTVYLASLGKV